MQSRPFAAFAVALVTARAQELPSQDVYRTPSPIVIDGKLDEAAWAAAPAFSPFHFSWWKEGEQEQTVARMLWDDENLYVSWYCHDRHISASVTRRHGPVSNDDCVEIFLSPNPEKPGSYYTFEINAIGTMLNRCRTDWWRGPPTWEPEGARYRTSYHGLPKKDESPDDDHWIVELAIPFKNFSRDAAHAPPQDGDRWRLNLNRTGGITNRQNSTWSPIPAPATSFHTPEGFGWVRFVSQVAPAAPGRRPRRASAQNPLGRSAETIAAGRELYNGNCTVCHGLNGTVGDRGPALAGARRYSRITDQDLFAAIKIGIAGSLMPPSGLADADIWKVVAYIRSLRASAYEDYVQGDVAHGAQIFWGKGRCADCHMIGGRGGLLGPDLSSIGAERTTSSLTESLTRRRPIPRSYQPVRITTQNGRTIAGVLKNEHNFSLQVLDAQGKLHLLLREEVREVHYEERSLMPSDYDKTLTASELQDLLAFLSRQAAIRTRLAGGDEEELLR